MTQVQGQSCRTCVYWLCTYPGLLDDGVVTMSGLCRRHSPIASTALTYPVAQWPPTASGHWCGDWSHKDATLP